jgi:hypothetical protein
MVQHLAHRMETPMNKATTGEGPPQSFRRGALVQRINLLH